VKSTRRRGRRARLQAPAMDASSAFFPDLEAADFEVPGRQLCAQAMEGIHGTQELESLHRYRSRAQQMHDLHQQTGKTADELEAEEEARKARMDIMTDQEKFREQEMKKKALSSIVGSQTTLELFELMDQLIDDDWLGGINEFPGNIYRMHAFKPLPEPKFPAVTRRVGFFIIVAIQLFGPPLLFYQMVTGKGIPDPDEIHWEYFQRLDLSDWHSNFWSTKLIGLLFLSCFCINGLFVHMDEAQSWKKIDILFRELNHCKLKNTSEVLLKVGAFMNMWVISWLCLDMFLVLGSSETVQDVLLDSLGLMFLYNLDDIGGDFGFVNQDDWPGLQLAWVFENIHNYSEELDDVEEFNPDVCCSYFLDGGRIMLTLLATMLPIVYVFTPFQVLIPDPLFEGLKVEADLKEMVEKIVKNMTHA